MPASTPYINAVELDIVPAEFEKFKAAILENAAASVKEPGCRQFDVLVEESNSHHVSCTRSTTTPPPWTPIGRRRISRHTPPRPRP
jgi:hypothetical protein